jgi:hypothetical protein
MCDASDLDLLTMSQMHARAADLGCETEAMGVTGPHQWNWNRHDGMANHGNRTPKAKGNNTTHQSGDC